jgi:FixJ family two-component response regulator
MAPVVYVVDDDSDLRSHISETLVGHGYRVVQSSTAEQFLNVFDPEQLGCILMDERMPGATGSKALEKIAKWLPIYPALLVTGYADVSLAVTVMKYGAFDIIEKPFSMERLLSRVKEAVAWNDLAWSKFSADTRVWTDLQKLTTREREILALIIDGHSSKNIGSMLSISARTVDNHRVHILSKMRAKSLSDLGRAVARASAIFGEGGMKGQIIKPKVRAATT